MAEEGFDSPSEVLNTCERDPDLGLELIEDTIKDNPDLRSNPFVYFAKFLAYGSKGIFSLASMRPDFRVQKASKNELRETLGMTDKNVEHLENSLQEIKEMEKIDPDALGGFGETGLAKLDAVSVTLEKFKPGRVEEIIGRTKLRYIFDRLKVKSAWSSLDPQPYLDVFFSCKTRLGKNCIARAALVVSASFEGDNSSILAALYKEPRVFNDSGEQNQIVNFVRLFEDGSYRLEQDISEE